MARLAAVVAPLLASWSAARPVTLPAGLGPGVQPVPPDPRPRIVRLALDEGAAAALAATETALAADPTGAAALDLDYLRADLLARLERPEEAGTAFEAVAARGGLLAAPARLRAARLRLERGEPEAAARLAAALLDQGAAQSTAAEACRILIGAREASGDCRPLVRRSSWLLAERERRLLALASAGCAARAGDLAAARAGWLALLRASRGDPTALLAAEHLDDLPGDLAPRGREAVLVGLALHEHRSFERAAALLERGIAEAPAAADGETGYALARASFWLDQFAAAASRFGELAANSAGELAARARYQEGRSLELSGAWTEAGTSFQAAAEASGGGRWAGAALLSALRLARCGGAETEALRLYARLAAHPSAREHRARAALFLAASDLVRGRADRAGRWLDDAAATGEVAAAEVAYWRGRLGEAAGRPATAVSSYLAARVAEPYHPLAIASGERLRRPALAALAAAEASRREATGHRADLAAAWRLRSGGPAAGAAESRMRAALAASASHRPFLDLAPAPPAAWPLWRTAPASVEERLLALGVWSEAGAAIRRAFPATDPPLALAGCRLLEEAGLPHRALALAEAVARRAPSDLPSALLAPALRRALYPLPWRHRLVTESRRHGTDPWTLAAVLREESRFDPRAVSGAQARGLGQFVLPTARRLAAAAGVALAGPADLERPEVSIALAASYLAALSARFADLPPAAIAAYNAGERQAELWRAYCFSAEPEEYLTKVGFQETREYLRRVLASRAVYRELYAVI